MPVRLYSAPAYAVQEGPERTETQKPKSDSKSQTLKVTLELGDGRSISGNIKFNAPDKITINHTKNDISYTKVISLQDFSEIQILKWKGTHLRKSKEGEVYKFNASAFSIKLTNGNLFIINENIFPFFEQLQIENSNGQVTLYTFWIDLLRTDGTWYTGMSGPTSGNRVTCHKDVIKNITFIKDE